MLIADTIQNWLSWCRTAYKRMRHKPILSVDALKQRLDSGHDVMVLDVRTAKEFASEQGHTSTACNIPLEQLLRRIHELDDYIQRPIAIVCHTDKRSLQAARVLTRHGFTDVHVVRGGITQWNRRGFPVER